MITVVTLVKGIVTYFFWRRGITRDENVIDSFGSSDVCWNVRYVHSGVGKGVNEICLGAEIIHHRM